MILVDTSVWIDHFRATDQQLVALLAQRDVLVHPCIIGEVALGGLKARVQVLQFLGNLRGVIVASHAEVMVFIDAHRLASTGVGYIDACIMASAILTPGAAIWTRDKKLRAQLARCGLTPPGALI